MKRSALLPLATLLACQMASSPAQDRRAQLENKSRTASVMVRLTAGKDSPESDHATVRYQGMEYSFSKEDPIDTCGFGQVTVVEQLPHSIWSVAIRLSADAARILAGRDRAIFGVFVNDTIRYVGPWLPWHPGQLDIDCESREAAYQLAATVNDAMAASKLACGREQARFEVETVAKKPSRSLLPATELYMPPLDCTLEARRAGLGGRLEIRVVIREDGTIDPTEWEVWKGDIGSLTAHLVERIAKTWKFRPAFQDGAPHSSRALLRIDYDCTRNN